MIMRQIVAIDEQKCDGCGLCVPGCEEGAIRIVGGKARLVSDVYCDGLGACLGHCPQGAISLIERPAEAFSEAAVARHLAQPPAGLPVLAAPGGCPGSQLQRPNSPSPESRSSAPDDRAPEDASPSRLANWPVQLHLVPPQAPYLQDADVLLTADCVPFALADFHRRFLDGRPVLIGCPKLDDGRAHVQKLAQIIAMSRIRSLTVVRMEVPCCSGLSQIARAAIELSGADVRLDEFVVLVRGQVADTPAS